MLVLLKRYASNPATGVVLALIALFLMADTFYLNRVRDQKADTLETAQQTLEAYQTSLQNEKQLGNLKPYLKQFHYGNFLKAALNAFKEAPNTLKITEIHVEQTQEAPQESHSFPRASKQKKAPLESKLTLRGQIRGNAQMDVPYQQLNEILSTIAQETGCTLQLFKGTEALPKESTAVTINASDQPLPFQFELQLIPKRQTQCWQRYAQPKEAS
jgi:hypothetical protein